MSQQISIPIPGNTLKECKMNIKSNKNHAFTSYLSCSHKILLIILLLLAMIILAVVPWIYYSMQHEIENKRDGENNEELFSSSGIDELDNVCSTLICKQSALHILNNMDESVEPCDDFYNFACGNFLNTTTIPDDSGSVDIFTMMNHELQKQLKNSLEELILPDEPKSFKNAKIFYKSCMDTAMIEQRGLEPFKKILKYLGGWPVIEDENWNETDFTWIESVYKCHEIGYSDSYFLNFGITPDVKNTTKLVIELDQASFKQKEFFITNENDEIDLLKRTNDRHNTFKKLYNDYMFDIAVMLGAPKNNKTMNQLEEAHEFKRALNNISLSEEERHNATELYNPMTVADLSIKHPSIPWKKYLNTIFAPNVTIDDDEIVIVAVPSYITKFEELINKTSKRTLANYVIWRVIEDSIYFLSENISDRQLNLLKDLSGISKREPRWKMCIEKASMLPSVQAMYIKKYFDKNAKRNIGEMVGDIRNQLNKTLHENDWMDDETKKNALDKANAMLSCIAYPDELLNDEKLKEIHEESLEFHDDKFMENILAIKLLITKETYNSFRNPFNRSDWMNHINVAVVNAFYNHIENSIELPAGILQGFIFNNHRPRYMNYGAIGTIIGHEVTHGFDDQGRQFDKDGHLENWWTPITDEEYRCKTECMIDQYSNYTVEEIDMEINGLNTLDENIADNGGFKLAYLAYKDWSERNGEEPTLPGLKFNPRQLFWITAANVWCRKVRNEIARDDIKNDIHSPGKFRVIGSFSNSESFANDFNCKEKSKMNPKNKCTLW
ncbi:hypothetical protein PV326_007046 [Microctonus aethiopoides]|nr:hypothetical protein PV326_007046 [Microctonus aethiopoides]